MREKPLAEAMYFSEKHGNIIRFYTGVHLDFGYCIPLDLFFPIPQFLMFIPQSQSPIFLTHLNPRNGLRKDQSDVNLGVA